MLHLPIFPLHEVAFPGQSLRLHIFEPRYRRLIQDCLAQDIPFGVALIRSGREVGGPLPEAFWVGCIVDFVRAEPLPYGRYQVYCQGRQRFRVLKWLDGHPYRMASIEPWPVSGTVTRQQENSLRTLLETYLRLLPLEHTPVVHPKTEHLKNLAFQAAAHLPIPLIQKQRLLESLDLSALIQALLHHYRKEISLLNLMRIAERGMSPTEENPLRFSQN